MHYHTRLLSLLTATVLALPTLELAVGRRSIKAATTSEFPIETEASQSPIILEPSILDILGIVDPIGKPGRENSLDAKNPEEKSSMDLAKQHQGSGQLGDVSTKTERQADSEVLLRLEGKLEEGDETLTDGSLYDTYTFEGEAGQFIEIRLNSDDFDTYLILVGPNGEWISRNDDSFDGLNSAIYIELPQTGTYSVLANVYDSSGEGEYRLAASEITTENHEQSSTGNNVIFQAEGLLEESDTRLRDESPYDIYMFEGQAGQFIQLRLESNDFDPYLILLDSSGEQIASNDDSIEGENALISIELPQTDRYLVVANAYNSSGKGEYGLTASEISADEYREFTHIEAVYTELGQVFVNGIYQYESSQFEEALGSFRKALELYIEVDNYADENHFLSDLKTYILLHLGNTNRILGQYQQALDLFHELLLFSREINSLDGESVALNALGIVFSDLGQYERAIEFYQESLAIARDVRNASAESYSLHSLGLTYFWLGQYERAVEYLVLALNTARMASNPTAEMYALGNLGLSYSFLEQHDLSLDLLQQAIAIAHELGEFHVEAAFTGNLGFSLTALGQHESAIDAYQQAITLLQAVGHRRLTGFFLGHLAQTLVQIDQPELAIIFLKVAVEVRESIRGDITDLDIELQQSFTDIAVAT